MISVCMCVGDELPYKNAILFNMTHGRKFKKHKDAFIINHN